MFKDGCSDAIINKSNPNYMNFDLKPFCNLLVLTKYFTKQAQIYVSYT